jgi:hypothetical protein
MFSVATVMQAIDQRIVSLHEQRKSSNAICIEFHADWSRAQRMIRVKRSLLRSA